ncbi:hypothetical protein NliqN6_4223 [Naganishia liquefaciens]|uniref:Signal peptidase complex subunit 1 n=1 Tax=Naganishia liquefaciens TaxID=104408 RepID=A0A8H3YHP8_9TREE|nr:hypothetical protein NliqN6_4223 [Naganishia liquefaciens]
MNSLLQPLQNVLEGTIDFEGQKTSETIAKYGLIASAFIAYFVAWSLGSVKYSMLTFGFGFLIVLLITIPPWPIYNSHPIEWLSVRRVKKE